MKKTALITGVTGQDGSYLAEFLLKRKYKVIGTTKNIQKLNDWRLKRLKIDKKITISKLNLNSEKDINRIFKIYKFDEFYNLAGHSIVITSFKNYLNTANNTAMGVIRILNAIKKSNRKIKFYQATTSEIFGDSREKFQNEESNFNPKNPYAISKLFAHLMTRNFREYHNIFAVSGILFNHESPLGGEEFVTRKIVKGLINILNNKQKVLKVGNIDSKRDWGFAKDYVRVMWKMMQQKKPNDFVISSGKAYTVKYFIDLVLKQLKIKGKWLGKKNERKFINEKKKVIIEISPKLIRKKEYKLLIGNSSKAKKFLKWRSKTNIKQLVKIMVTEEKKFFKL